MVFINDSLIYLNLPKIIANNELNKKNTNT